jgi:putative tricarboxylic transport membrane protein
MRAVDRAVGAAIALLGVAVYLSSRSFPNVPGQKLGASTLPGIVGAAYDAGGGEPAASERIAPAIGILASIGLYLAASDALGYLPVAPLALLVALRSLQVGWARAIGWAIVASLAVHLAFYKLLKVPLPWGVVPVLY